MKTKIHYYFFNVSYPIQNADYLVMADKLRAEKGRGHWHNVMGKPAANDRHTYAKEITLETKHLFKNQWNADVGRVFDWYEGIGSNPNVKLGHWLEMTEEMKAIRQNTLACGYTGQQFPADCGFVFNETERALGSPYLKETELLLLRLQPINTRFDIHRPELSKAEFAYLLPKYIEAQTKYSAIRNQERKARQIKAAQAEYAKALEGVKRAENKRDGFLWLINNDVSTENVIYYPHTGRFSFGWQSKLSPSVAANTREILKDFPFNYDIEEDNKQ